MRVSDHVLYAIADAEMGRFESALLHACIAVDGTARRLFPSVTKVRERYIRCLRNYYWVIEPMLGGGLNLVDTRFSNVPLPGNPHPDFAEIVYEVFRCSHAHGDEVPPGFSVIPTQGPFGSQWALAGGELHMPDRVVWALLAVAVFSRANVRERTTGDYYLSLGEEHFPLAEWWGREDDFRPIAERYNQVRVTIERLDRLRERDPAR